MARTLALPLAALALAALLRPSAAAVEEQAAARPQAAAAGAAKRRTSREPRIDVGAHAREDAVNRMLSLFASAPMTLDSPEARDLLAQLRAMSQGRGANSIAELAQATSEQRQLPPRPQALMRRGGAAAAAAAGHGEAALRRQRGQGEAALAQGTKGAGRAAGGLRQYPPLPELASEPAPAPAEPAHEAAHEGAPGEPAPEAVVGAVELAYSDNHTDFPLEGAPAPTPWWQSLPASLDDVPPPGHYDKVEVPEYWIEDGCRFGVGAPLRGNFSAANLRVAKVQCCTTGQGISCSRKHESKCLLDETSELVTHAQATKICESSGMRLCSKTEMHDSPDALGCCGTGCGMDDFFTWTDTLSPKSEAVLNRKLTRRINDLRSRNLRLLKEHLSEELRLEALKASMTPEMTITTTPAVLTAASEEINNIITRNDDLKKTYDTLKEENELLRKRVKDMLAWSKSSEIVAPSWFNELKNQWQDTSRYSDVHTNKTWKETPSDWAKGKGKMDLHWIHRYDDKDYGWRWTTATTTIWYRHEGDNKYHGRMGAYDSWPPENVPGEPDSEFWPVEKPVPTTPEPPRPEWLPQPPAKGHLENYDEAHHKGLFDTHYQPLWNRYR